MYIPTKWVKATGTGQLPDGRKIPASAWGWGDDEDTAASKARTRLQKVLERLRRGESFPEKYAYEDRPVREEILEVIRKDADDAKAIVTRNRHGVQVLNTARILFLDIDIPPVSSVKKLLTRVGLARDMSEAGILSRLRQTLQQYSRATFRIYRTAGGVRVMATDREFNPDGREADELMRSTGTDPDFMRLCKVQHSFRARLTPKPWRCGSSSPPVPYPRDDSRSKQQFASWLADYETACTGYATCRYLETVGHGRSAGFARASIELHDRVTRCDELLPLA